MYLQRTKKESESIRNTKTNWELTLELLAWRKSCDINFKMIADGGRRCIRALHTRLAPAPPWRHRPLIICMVRSSKLSRGKRVIKLINSFRFSSATSVLHSDERRVRSRESKQGWTRAKLSDDLRDCSNWATPCRRWRQFWNWIEKKNSNEIFKFKYQLHFVWVHCLLLVESFLKTNQQQIIYLSI